MDNDKWWIISATASVLVVFVAFLAILWQIGLFDFTGTEASTKIIAAALALVGTLIGSIITIIGIYLKQSIDRRNADLKEQAETRLKLEAAVHALKLLSTKSGEEVPMTQRTGVLFMLTNLGLCELAITMLDQMLATNRIDANSASFVINFGLESNNGDLQQEAAALLRTYPDRFLIEKGIYQLPKYLVSYTWNMKLHKMARQELVLGLLRMIAERPFKEWDEGSINSLVIILSSIWKNEQDERIRTDLGICFDKILSRSRYERGSVLHSPTKPVDIDVLRKELSRLSGKVLLLSSLYKPIYQQLEKW